MKRIVCILVVVALLVSGSIFEALYVSNTINNLLLVSESVIDGLEKERNELEKVNALGQYWEEREKYICLFINHKDMEQIGEQIKKAQSYLEKEDKENALYEMKQLNYVVQSFKHISQFNAQNIF